MSEQPTTRVLGMQTCKALALPTIVRSPISTREIGPAIGDDAQATLVGGAPELPTPRRGSW
jgi:hypothetical protein